MIKYQFFFITSINPSHLLPLNHLYLNFLLFYLWWFWAQFTSYFLLFTVFSFPLIKIYFCFSFCSFWFSWVWQPILQKRHQIRIVKLHIPIHFIDSFLYRHKWKCYPNPKLLNFYCTRELFKSIEFLIPVCYYKTCRYALD